MGNSEKSKPSKDDRRSVKLEIKKRMAAEKLAKIEKHRNVEGRSNDNTKVIEIGTVGNKAEKPAGKMSKLRESLLSTRKDKKEREKINWRLACKEFPVKMAKEISRIRWVPKGSLGRRFLVTILFIIAFAIFYVVVDEVLQHVFNVAHII